MKLQIIIAVVFPCILGNKLCIGVEKPFLHAKEANVWVKKYISDHGLLESTYRLSTHELEFDD